MSTLHPRSLCYASRSVVRRIEPSDAQQMLLEMVPEARWEIVKVTEDFNPETLETQVRIATRVSLMRVVEIAGDIDIEIDFLNEETRTEVVVR